MGMVGEAEPGKGGQGHTVRGTQSQVERAGEQKGLQSLEAKALCCARAGCVGAGGPLAGALLEEQR